MCASGHESALLDFRRIPKADTDTFLMSGVEHDKYHELDWTRVYDGVMFIREMSGLSLS